jgi:endonuclease YncB( thermonuclease family)
MKTLALFFAAILVSLPARAAEFITYGAIDGDTIIIAERCNLWNPANTRVRIFGIDTPESRLPPAKCEAEVKLGKAAKAFAQGLIKRGDRVIVTYVTKDKYSCRIVGTVTLPDGRDFAKVMIAAGLSRPYGLTAGALTKSDWCK